jgi:hypothetical protein
VNVIPAKSRGLPKVAKHNNGSRVSGTIIFEERLPTTAKRRFTNSG